MMTYEQLKPLKAAAFKRRSGVHPETFEQMVEVLRPQLDRRGKQGGQCKLSVEDQLLVVLEYWREYRTQLHIATSWGLSESAVCRLIHKVEGLLMDSAQFRSSTGQKAASSECLHLECHRHRCHRKPYERPKKNNELTTVVRKSGIP